MAKAFAQAEPSTEIGYKPEVEKIIVAVADITGNITEFPFAYDRKDSLYGRLVCVYTALESPLRTEVWLHFRAVVVGTPVVVYQYTEWGEPSKRMYGGVIREINRKH